MGRMAEPSSDEGTDDNEAEKSAEN
jgi:hypothetical protein